MIARDDSGSAVPHCTNYVYAHLPNLDRPDRVGITWKPDGAHAYRHWWVTS
ncbi:MAG: hypothetical protein AAF280_09190 [Pseudomonadota bacterium]